MTIKKLLKELKKMPSDAVIKMASSPEDSFVILSIYLGDSKKIVWIDILREQ